MGALTQAEAKEWAQRNRTLLLILGAALAAFLIYWFAVRPNTLTTTGAIAAPATNRAQIIAQRRKGILRGAQAAPADTTAAPTTPAAATTPAPAPTPAVVAAPAPVPVTCQMAGIPKPINVYQDDLSGANDNSGMGGPVPFSAGGPAGVPIDATASCGGVNPSATWQSSTLLPLNCGQSLQGVSDWSLYAPSSNNLVNLIGAGQLTGQDTVMTTLKNAR
jgi:hypothetical protein